VTASPLVDPKDSTVGFVYVFRDITELKSLRDTETQRELNYREILDDASDLIMSISPKGEILYVNRTWHSKMGYGPEDIPRLGLLDILSPDCMEACLDVLQRSLRGEKIDRIETTFITRDGRALFLEGHCNIRIRDGKSVAVIGIFRDITERRKAEEERRKLDAEMQDARRMESIVRLTGGIAHKFNNLMNSVLGNAELALIQAPEESKVRRHLQRIEEAALKAADLVRQMLAFAGTGASSEVLLDLSSELHQMADLLQTVIPAGVSLKLSSDARLPSVQADRHQIGQMIMHLVNNASEALEGGAGTITVTTGLIDADAAYLADAVSGEGLTPGPYVYLEVADTGCGIDPAHKAVIFEPFFTTKFIGRGLGLPATLGIVKSTRGCIKVESVPGQGTRIRVLFPVAETEQDGSASPDLRPSSPGGPTERT